MRCSQQQQQPPLATTASGEGALPGNGEPGTKMNSPHSGTALRHQQRGIMDGTLSDSMNIQQAHHHQTMTSGAGSSMLFNTKNQGGLIAGGTLGLQSNIVVVERNGSIRQSVDHTSPTSSAGSTHLIYNGQHALDSQQDWNYPQTLLQQQSSSGSQPFLHPANHHYHHHQVSLKHPSNPIDYRKNSMSSLSSTSSPSPRHLQRQAQAAALSNTAPKEYFYWTEKRSSAGRRNNTTNRNVADLKPGGTAMALAANQHIIRSDTMNAIYPSYRKNPTHYSVASNHDPDEEHDDEDHPGSYLARYDQQRQCGGELYDIHLHNHHHHLHHPQSNLPPPRSGGGSGSPPPLGGIEHLQMLLQNQTVPNIPHGRAGEGTTGAPNTAIHFYNQYQPAPGGFAIEEPVYEEIMSNRGSRADADDAAPNSPHNNHLRQSNSNRYEIMIFIAHLALLNFSFMYRPLVMGSSYTFQSPHHLHSSVPSSNDHQQQHQPLTSKSVGRNLSAMLDENNTVVCYLEPMANQ